MTRPQISAEVITCRGSLGDDSYPRLRIRCDEFESPYVLTLALPAVVYRALSEQARPLEFFNAIAEALNYGRAALAAGQARIRDRDKRSVSRP